MTDIKASNHWIAQAIQLPPCYPWGKASTFRGQRIPPNTGWVSNHLTAPSPSTNWEGAQTVSRYLTSSFLIAEIRQDKAYPKLRLSLISCLSHTTCLNACMDAVKPLWLTGLLFVSWAVTAGLGMNSLCVHVCPIYEKTPPLKPSSWTN